MTSYAVRTITCVGCGKVVTGRMPAGRRYCSLDCYRNGTRPTRKTGEMRSCAFCGKEVYIPAFRLGLSHYFCSHEHANEWQGRNKTSHNCKTCGKEFRWSPSREKSYNITYCSLKCRDADPDWQSMLVEMNAKQQRGMSTKLETMGYALLDELDIPHLRQHVIGGKFCVDAFVSHAGVVIQFDGDYWHGNPLIFPNPDTRQQKRMRLDISQDAYMVACGYRVIRVWQSELEDDRQAIIQRLQDLAIPEE